MRLTDMAHSINSIKGGARRGERHQNDDALFIRDYLRRGLARFKLRAHLLDLRALLFELRSETLYFLLLLGDCCLQLLNFEIELGFLFAFRNVWAQGGGFEFGGA